MSRCQQCGHLAAEHHPSISTSAPPVYSRRGACRAMRPDDDESCRCERFVAPPRLPGWTEPVTCPGCHQGYLRQVTGRYGPFYGCTCYPACRTTLSPQDLGRLLDPDDGPYFGE